MTLLKRTMAGIFTACMAVSCIPYVNSPVNVDAVSESIADTMKWDTLKVGGGGFVSGIVTGQKEMYLRTDVGGAYKFDYEQNRWIQLFDFLNEEERGLLSVKGMAIDPNDDDTAYFLCGCAYFSGARTVIYKTTDGGETFTEADVTDMIQVHGNGDGRECCEPIAIDPDNTDTIYAGGDVTAGESALIKSTDGGKTWSAVKGYDDLGLFDYSMKYPFWTDHVVRGCEDKGEQGYNQQNGIGTIHIEDGKVYVGTSVTGQANIHVADVKDDKFTELSADLPNSNYPVSITSDRNGNLFFTYIAGLAFSGSAGGAYKYNVESGDVKNLSVTDSAVGMVTVDKNDPNKMVARTCGVWSDQWYEEEWTDGSIAWGDYFYRSTDGGETWQNITPGQGETIYDENGSHKEFVSLPIDTNGYEWIYGKACHWGSGILIDPRNSDRILMTSGNGVFACDNTWDESGVQFYFQPDGVEEVVALDFVSVPGGTNYSVIGDYDGFIHESAVEIPHQYTPNIGSTSAIAYCPSDTKVMARVGEHDAKGYYSLDGGKTWEDLKVQRGGGKLAITQLEDGSYRFIHASSDNASISYSDDFGATWSNSTGLDGSKTTYPLVDPENPAVVYGSGIKYNDYWASDTSKKEPTLDDAQYNFYISTDYGATFKKTTVCKYDMCDHTGDLAYITDDTIAMAVGWEGMYIITDGGTNIEKSDVFYAKTVGYGAPEKEGDANTLFIYGKPDEDDVEGVYRSTDAGKTWVCINTDHLYGGTGNGNFLVGDMNEFGTVYMSTVGCGIVYGELSDGQGNTKPTKPTTPSEIAWGDADESGKVELNDAVLIMQSIANPDKYKLTEQGKLNSDVVDNGKGITNSDALAIQYIESRTITTDDLPMTSKELEALNAE
ncbi:MAG: 1,4-beta-glucanase [Ruminococcus sp.]|nr:1,4-beta-glucanase [Ruminococcus sp.]MDE6848919.1 1,4-beta-glucanase [Ruminococcus sp.]